MESLNIGAVQQLLAISGVMMIPVLAVLVFSIVCWWKIFIKMGEPGWKSLIPVYNGYIIFNKTWDKKFFFLSLAAIVVSGIFMVLSPIMIAVSGSAIVGFIFMALSVLCIVAMAVISIIMLYKLANAFGQGALYFILLLLVNIVGLALIAFGSARYTLGGINDGGYNNDDYDAEEDLKNTEDAMNGMLGQSVMDDHQEPVYSSNENSNDQIQFEQIEERSFEDNENFDNNGVVYNEDRSGVFEEVQDDVDASEISLDLESEDEAIDKPQGASLKLNLSKEAIEEKKAQVNNTLNLHIIE